MLDHLGIVFVSWPASIRNYHQMAADTVYLKPQSQNTIRRNVTTSTAGERGGSTQRNLEPVAVTVGWGGRHLTAVRLWK